MLQRFVRLARGVPFAMLLVACRMSGPQTLLIAADSYTLDRARAADLVSFDNKARTADPVVLQSCQCVEFKRLWAAMEWAKARGFEKISVGTLPPDDPRCGGCD